MMKRKIMIIAILCAVLSLSAQTLVQHKDVVVSAPFAMPAVKELIFPERDFNIQDYGAQREEDNTQAIAAAIAACHAAGGGRVVVPAGEWQTGAIHLQSNVCLHIEDGGVLCFSDNPADYLPAVFTSWEGMECYNYSPLVYAYNCENVAITGGGMLKPKMGEWRKWFARPQAHLNALKELYTQASTDVAVAERQMAVGENHLRPHLIHFNRCKNIVLDGFKIRESPFWTIHIYHCEGGIVRNLDVSAHGHNNDGIDIEMTRNVLIENCVFDQGDDAVVIKAGRNRDAWRLATPSENIVVRNCTINGGHTLLGIGSEMSGGVRNVLMQDCEAPKTVHRIFFAKTNHRRGGFIEDIYMKNIHVGGALNVLEVDMDVLYQWRELVPTYEERLTRIKGLHLEDISCDAAKALYIVKGDERQPINTITLKNIRIGTIGSERNVCENAQWMTIENVGHDRLDASVLPELTKYITNK